MRLETRTLSSLLLPHNGLGASRARPPERSGDRGAPRAKAKGVRGGEAPRIWSGAAMKLFVDSGNIKDIETLAAIGIIDGVTTNPSLLAKEPGDYRQNLKRICDIVKGPVSGEVVSTESSGMIREGQDIATIDQHMVVKVPLTRDGVRACKALSGEGIRVTVRLCFSAAQALL